MKLAISNIAWEQPEESQIASELSGLGVAGIEIAPTKRWPDLTKVSDSEIEEYREFWINCELQPVAMQALLFGHPELTVFEDPATRLRTLDYLEKVIVLAGRLGTKILVFGSPKNRHVGNVAEEEAAAISSEFFRKLGTIAESNGVVFCIEPNPPEYGCDFITTASEGIDLVRRVDNPGFGLHLDTGGMVLSGEDVARVLAEAGPVIRHFHISEPFLEPVGNGKVDHEVVRHALEQSSYDGDISIEMKSEGSDNVARVRDAVRFTRDTYGLR